MEIPTLKKWLSDQARIYKKFEDQQPELETKGTVCTIPSAEKGYVLLFRHHPWVSAELSQISYDLVSCLPIMESWMSIGIGGNIHTGMYYRSRAIHTTVLDDIIRTPRAEFQLDESIIKSLIQASAEVVAQRKAPKVNLSGILAKPDTVIVKATEATEGEFYGFANALYQACQKRGLERMGKYPWAPHSTLLRHRKNLTPEQIQQTHFLEELKQRQAKFSPKQVQFKFLDVTSFDYSIEAAKFTIHERLELSN